MKRSLALPHSSARPVRDSTPYDAIDAYVEQHMHRLNIPGVSLAIVEGDTIVHLRGFGQARSNGEAPTPHTPFVLGSATKSFTAPSLGYGHSCAPA
jgi:CubicO group peptidase (beta-lactamase class C family)